VGAIYCQLMIGAVMRHFHAGLSIPDFPLAFGRLIPPMINGRVAIHFAHRVGALVVTLMALTLAALIFTAARRHVRLARAAAGLVAAVAVQVALGASVIWTGREPVITSLHVVNGAAVLTIALLLAMRATKLKALLQPARERQPSDWHQPVPAGPYKEAQA
jgi:cytochrome c oxidase assembly protein subunit 15